jgi:signal transduction histidine kinase
VDPFLDLLTQHGPGILFRQRADLSFEFASPQLEELTGRPLADWQRQPALFWQTIHESDLENFRVRVTQAGCSLNGIHSEFRIRHAATGRIAYISEFRCAQRDSAGQLLGYQGFWLDLTRQILSERRLATAGWKETVSVLTLGLAHDFNNVLAGVLGISESFLAQIEPDHPFHEGLTLMKRNARHSAESIQRIAQISRSKTGVRDYHDLNELVRKSSDLVRTAMPRRIQLNTQLSDSELAIYVDAVELQQSLIGLALSAADAMPDGGQLTIETARHETPPRTEHCVGTLPGPPLICLAVSNTGPGIEARSLPHVFQPFFTIRRMKHNSGLGVYNARLFTEKHHGAISVQSQEGVGTTFCIWLPLADFTEADRAIEISNQRPRSILLTGGAGMPLSSTAEFLRRHNYHVVIAGSDLEELLGASDYQFDGILILATPQDPEPTLVSGFLRQQNLDSKLIVKAVNDGSEEFEPELFGKVDLIISSHAGEDLVLEKLRAVFDVQNGK